MGEPARATDAQRAETMALATAVMDSVRNDEPMPLAPPDTFRSLHRSLWTDDHKDINAPLAADAEIVAWLEKLDLAIFRLSQDLVDTRTALERACSAMQGNYTESERGELAERLLKLDLEEPESQ